MSIYFISGELQIAEELRRRLPNVIGARFPLRQLWGFKNTRKLPGNSTTHADFAAVNVNFWITPTSANKDPDSGGLLVYGLDAPQDWDFNTYNGRLDLIQAYLRNNNAKPIRIPYRQNRAIIFNSDLFHCTEVVDFGELYEEMRINVTMLYGDRADDFHHKEVSARGLAAASSRSWRSAALVRGR